LAVSLVLSSMVRAMALLRELLSQYTTGASLLVE